MLISVLSLTSYTEHLNVAELVNAIGFIIFIINEVGRYFDRRKIRRAAKKKVVPTIVIAPLVSG